jgi:hypothetical protein
VHSLETTKGVKHRGAARWTKAFLLELLSEIREKICGDTSGKTKSGKPRRAKKSIDKASYGYALATWLASYLMTAMHISSSMALGLAALILIKIAQSTRNAFCKMTDREVLDSILKDLE